MFSVIFIALLLGAVLAGDRLAATARSLELGPVRTVAVAAASPFEFVAVELGLSDLRAQVGDALDAVSQPAAGPVPNPSGTTSQLVQGDDPGNLVGSPAGAVGADGAPATPSYRNPRPTTADPLEFLIVGDSMTESFGKYLKADLIETGIVAASHDFKYSSGLARPDFFDWPEHLAETIPSKDPDAVLIMIGANDGQGMTVDGKAVQFGSEKWKREYAKRVARTMEILSADQRRGYWVGLPIARSQTYADKVKVRNRICRDQASQYDNVVYVDTWNLFAAPDGTYTAYLRDGGGDRKLMRNEDGIHLSVSGAHFLTDHILDIMAEDYPIAQ